MSTATGWPKHAIKCQQFSRQQLEDELFPEARLMQNRLLNGNGLDHPLAGKKMVILFYEPSSRTRYFFREAMVELGGTIRFETENAGKFSSASKGESLKHTMKVFSRADVIVLRHDQEGAVERAAAYLDAYGSKAQLMNAGDGLTGQHPSQSFVDLFTMQERFGRIDGLSIAFVGDLEGNRAVNSNAYNLGKFDNVTQHFISPSSQPMDSGVLRYLEEKGARFTIDKSFQDVIGEVDVIYMVRTKLKERREAGKPAAVFDGRSFILDKGNAQLAKPDCIFMHPMPVDEHVQEIRPDVEDDPRCIFWREQLDNHLPVRMAMLKLFLTS
jgi:aspartate carbamoyltransferase catalytic subunit